MKKYLLASLAIIILVALGTAIAIMLQNKSKPSLWNPTMPPMESKESRSGKRDAIVRLKTFTDATLKFSMKVPETWTMQREGGGIYFLSDKTDAADTIRENINILRDDLKSKPQTLEQYTQSAIDQVKGLDHYTLIGMEDITIDGLPGKTMVYTAMVKNTLLTFQQAWTVKALDAYVLTLAAGEKTFPEFSPLFVRMVNSLKLL